MQFFLLKPLAAILTFIIGAIAALYFAPLPRVEPVGYTPPPPREVVELIEPVTIADLLHDPHRYDGRLVLVEAAAITYGRSANSVALYDPWESDAALLQGECAGRQTTCRMLHVSARSSSDYPIRFFITGRFSARQTYVPGRKVSKPDPVLEISQAESIGVSPRYEYLREQPEIRYIP